MSKLLQWSAVAVIVLLVLGVPAWAQDGGGASVNGPHTAILSGAAIGAGIGAAITIIGAGYGFGRIGSSSLESMARQLEIAGQIQTAMLIIAALLEGATFFSLIVCIILQNQAKW